MRCSECNSEKVYKIDITINSLVYSFVTCSTCHNDVWFCQSEKTQLSKVLKEVKQHPKTVSAHRPILI